MPNTNETPTEIICCQCEETISNYNFKCSATQWGSEWGTADFDESVIDYEDSDWQDGESDDYCYSCPNCEHEFSCQEREEMLKKAKGEETKEKKKSKPEPIISQDSDMIEDRDYEEVDKTDCPKCKRTFEIGDDEKDCCCPNCGHEFKTKKEE